MPGTESVRVVVRVRPLDKNEVARGNASILDVDRGNSQVMLFSSRAVPPKVFAFDAVYGPDAEQQLIYDETGFPLIENILEGYNGTIFAYGQTGCGKTFTMSGKAEHPGIIPNAFKHIFSSISDTGADRMFLVYCSYVEIYNEEIRDLLKYDPKTKLELKEKPDSGVFIKGLQKESVATVSDIMRLMDQGASHRTTKETAMNEHSSRSHSIFTVYVEMSVNREDGAHLKAGKLNLVDLAGSERQKKTQAEGDRLKEAIEINLSLSALGNVISALVDGHSSHIPYRDSKLTRLLQDSLGGNTKTIMIAVASPADYNYDESLSTLRYASRAKFIQNRPTVNEDPKDALLRQYVEEINRLKQALEGQEVEVKYVEKIVYVEEDEEGSFRQEGKARAVKGEGKSSGKKPVPSRDKGAPLESGRIANSRGTSLAQAELEDDSEEEPTFPAQKPTELALASVEKKAKSRPKASQPAPSALEDDSSSEGTPAIQSAPKHRAKAPKRTLEDPVAPRRQGKAVIEQDSDSEKDTAPRRKGKIRPQKQPEAGPSALDEAKTGATRSKREEKASGKHLGSRAQLAVDSDEGYSDEFLPEESAEGVSSSQGKTVSVKQGKEADVRSKGNSSHTTGGKKPLEPVAIGKKAGSKAARKESYSDSEGYQDDFETEARQRGEEYGEDFEPEDSQAIAPSRSVQSLQVAEAKASLEKGSHLAKFAHTQEKVAAVKTVERPPAKQSAGRAVSPLCPPAERKKPAAKAPSATVASMRSSKAQPLAASSSASEGEDPDQALLAMVRQKVVRGGQAQDQKGEMERMKERRRKLLLQQQQARPKSRIDSDEQLFKEIKCESLQEEAEKQRKVLEMLDMKVQSAMAEIQDLNHEHEAEKEDLLSTVRVKERDSGLLYRILEKVISPEQLSLIKQKSKFDDDNNSWKVPPFLFQPNKPLTFPKLPKRQAQELVETELLSKTLRFPEDPERLRSLEGRRRGVSQPGVEENWPRSALLSDEFPAAVKRSYIS